jgi:hypothetical protein
MEFNAGVVKNTINLRFLVRFAAHKALVGCNKVTKGAVRDSFKCINWDITVKIKSLNPKRILSF